MKLNFIKCPDEVSSKLKNQYSLSSINGAQVMTPFGLIKYSETVILNHENIAVGKLNYSLIIGDVIIAVNIVDAVNTKLIAQHYIDERIKEVQAIQDNEIKLAKEEKEKEKDTASPKNAAKS